METFVLCLLQSGQLKEVNPKWLAKASGSFNRAAVGINLAIDKTDLTDQEACRLLNDRLMRVSEYRHAFLWWNKDSQSND